jgi:MFS family permease
VSAVAQSRRVKATVGALSLSTFVQWLGASAVLPLLPLFLRQHGSSDTLVGATMAAYFAAAFLAQYPAGRLSDRIGRRPVQIAGLGLYALASLTFAFVPVPAVALLLRALQGAGSGVVQVGSAAVIGETVPDHWRGRAFALFYGSQTAGLAIGPLVGTLAGASSMRPVFLAAATCAALACLPIGLLVPGGRPPGPTTAGDRPARTGRALARRAGLLGRRAVLGVVAVAVSGGLLTGTYEVCWSLLLRVRGAHDWQIGLSWTLFAVPFVAMSVPAGWLVDHFDRRYLAAFSMLASATFVCTYPWVHSVTVLIGLVTIEATTIALGAPAMLSQLSTVVGLSELGRAQGVVSSSSTAATAIAAAVAGPLFGVHAEVPFLVAGAGVLLCTATLPACWHGVPARAAPALVLADAPAAAPAAVAASVAQVVG